MKDAFICDAVRTPIGRYAGSLAAVRTDDLGAIPIKALMERNPSVDWSKIDDIDVESNRLTLMDISGESLTLPFLGSHFGL